MTEQPTALTVAQVADRGSAVLDEVATLVVGMKEPLKIALAAVLGGGHVLFEDVPGLGKTLAARSLATALGLAFRRVQCTPDLLPSDITGSSVFDPATASFAFRPGPVFAGLLLTDEINRTAPKTQSALLEAMAERQVTVDGTTYPLPEAQLDRFMVRVAVGYPERDAEVDVLARRLARRQEMGSVRTVVDAATLRAMQAGVEAVTVDGDILRYCVDLAAATRAHDAVEVGASPRGSQALVLVARSLAVLSGRDFVTPEDVKAVAVPALAHRLSLTPQAWATGMAPQKVVADVLTRVAGPTTARRL